MIFIRTNVKTVPKKIMQKIKEITVTMKFVHTTFVNVTTHNKHTGQISAVNITSLTSSRRTDIFPSYIFWGAKIVLVQYFLDKNFAWTKYF